MVNNFLSDTGPETALGPGQWKDQCKGQLKGQPQEPVAGATKADPFAQQLQLGPLEFLQAAQASPSLRAMRYTFEGEQALHLDLALASYYKFVTQRAPANERLSELLQDIIDDAPHNSLVTAEAHCLLAVYQADDGDLSSSVHSYQCAVDAYAALDRTDALAVCFARHALTLYERGYFREADSSLRQAQQFAAAAARPLYVQYCQLVQSLGSIHQGRAEAAATSAGVLSTGDFAGPGERALFHAMHFRIAVERDDLSAAESAWQALLQLQSKGIPVGAIATRTRVALLLKQGQFSDATDVVLHFLHGSPLASAVSKHQLMLDLIKHPSSAVMADSVKALFEELLEVNERAIRQDPCLEVGIAATSRTERHDGSLSHA